MQSAIAKLLECFPKWVEMAGQKCYYCYCYCHC